MSHEVLRSIFGGDRLATAIASPAYLVRKHHGPGSFCGLTVLRQGPIQVLQRERESHTDVGFESR